MKRVCDLKPGDDVIHMLGVKRIKKMQYEKDNVKVRIDFTDDTWDVIYDFMSLNVPDCLEGDTLEDKNFAYHMEIHRSTTLTMGGFPSEQILTTELVDKLDAYEQAYKKMYLEKWGKAGPHGAVLRQESEEETRTRILWEDAVIRYWHEVDTLALADDTLIIDTTE